MISDFKELAKIVFDDSKDARLLLAPYYEFDKNDKHSILHFICKIVKIDPNRMYRKNRVFKSQSVNKRPSKGETDVFALICFVFRHKFDMSYPEIADYFNYRQHGGIMKYINTNLPNVLATDKSFRATTEAILNLIDPDLLKKCNL